MAQFQHEVTSLKESKDQQLHELKRINDETCRAREAAFEKKVIEWNIDSYLFIYLNLPMRPVRNNVIQ